MKITMIIIRAIKNNNNNDDNDNDDDDDDDGQLQKKSQVQSLAGPTLRVFKYLSRKCCLCTVITLYCNYICKWLDSGLLV